MSASTLIKENIKPEDVTAWTYDISIQMLQDQIAVLKDKSTEENTKQIKDKEKEVMEKKEALEKHCRAFGIAHGRYGTDESAIKLETANHKQTGVTNGDVKDSAHSDTVKMDLDNTASPIDAADAAASAALDEIKFPEAINSAPQQTSTEGPSVVDAADVNDPFITVGDASLDNYLLAPSSHAHHFADFGDFPATYPDHDDMFNRNDDFDAASLLAQIEEPTDAGGLHSTKDDTDDFASLGMSLDGAGMDLDGRTEGLGLNEQVPDAMSGIETTISDMEGFIAR